MTATPDSAKTNITWTPTSVNTILSPGETQTISITFTSTKNIARVSAQVSLGIQSLVQVQPQFLDRVRKGVPKTIILTLASPANAALGTSTGTIQLRKERKDSNDNDEGDEEPDKLLPQMLLVTASVWQAFADTSLGLSFKYPPFSQPTKAVRSTGLLPGVDVQIWDPSQQQYVSLIGISIHSNPAVTSLQQWFEQNVDVNGILASSNTFQQQPLQNGLSALVLVGPVPSQYLALSGPVEEAYLMSPAEDRVVSITQSQVAQVSDFSYDPMTLLTQVLGTIKFY
jgi:hypothetical protein